MAAYDSEISAGGYQSQIEIGISRYGSENCRAADTSLGDSIINQINLSELRLTTRLYNK